MAKTSSRDLDKFIVRLPPGMRDKIAAAAGRANRTMNSEIVSRLEFTFDVELVVQDGGFDFSHDFGSPEMMASFVKHQLGEDKVNPTGDDDLKARVTALEAQLEGNIPDLTLRDRVEELEAQIAALLRKK